ncbi:DUF4080 domain-containing protein [Oscillospiraceae bacterium CM]|nr:DUF4080 domain-containing protein [Oscillospiraceae bacterium CM]
MSGGCLHAVIAAINSKYIHASLAPWYLLAGLETFGDGAVSAEVVEGTVNEELAAVAARIIEKSPGVLGLSCYIWNIAFIKKLLPVIKNALPDAVIILGGPEVSYNTGDILRDEPLVDYVISGEGEMPFARLLTALTSGGSTAGIPGLCYRSGGGVAIAPPYAASDDPPNPYTEAYFMALNGRIAYLETSRGCPFACAFCLSGRTGTVRFFNLERAKRDMLLLANSGTQTVKLVDRTFNADKRRARTIFQFLIRHAGKGIPEGVSFHFEIAGELLDDETLDVLAAAPKGLFQFEIGLQSFHAPTLEAINRRTDCARLKHNIERLTALGNIHIHIDLIAGLPFEDLQCFAESFNKAFALSPHVLQLGFLKLLHGAPLREDPLVDVCRFSLVPPYEVRMTPWLTPAAFDVLQQTAEALERLYNSGRFRRTLVYVLKQSGLTPFELFSKAGEFLNAYMKKGSSLDELTARILNFFSALPGVDGAVLRDRMVCDRLATNVSGKLPSMLKMHDDRFKKAVNRLRDAEMAQGLAQNPKGTRRGYALLCSEKVLVYADYRDKDPVTGEYALTFVKLPEKDDAPT